MSQILISLLRQAGPASALALATVAVGCSSTSPVQRAPELPASLFAAESAAPAQAWPSQSWWQGFKDPQLNALIEHALGANPDLAAAQAAARRAAALSSEANAAALPSVEMTGSATRQRFTENGLVPPPYAGAWMNSGNVSARLAWNLDLFGADRSRRAAVLSSARAAALDAGFARNAISAAVAQLYFELGEAYADRDLLQLRQQHGERLRAIAAGRRSAGLDDATATRRQEAQLAVLRVELTAAEERIAVAGAQLAALAGEGPQWTPALQRPALPALPADGGVPPALSAELLGRRADVAAARERVLAAADGVDAARRDYFPNLSLTALAGLDSFALSSLFDGASRAFSAGPALSLPLFDAGRRRAASAQRLAEYDVAVADYRRSVLAAVSEASQALLRLQSTTAQQASAVAALDAETAASRIVLRRAERGLASDAEALLAQDRAIEQQRRVARLAAQRRSLLVEVFRALGGGAILPGERS